MKQRTIEFVSERFIRAFALAGLLVIVGIMAVWYQNQQAIGACTVGLGLALSFIFRGKQTVDTPSTTEKPIQNP